MVFYHGTSEIIDIIDFNRCRLRTDFGRGFYVSSKLGPAKEWASGKAGFSGIPTVMRYDIKAEILDDKSLNILRFDRPSKQWLDFIRDNRRMDNNGMITIEPRHSYDVVSGPIANDKVADVVAVYCKGRISADDAIAKVQALQSVFQLSLHTPLALSYVIRVSYSQRSSTRWSEWK